MKIIQNIKRWFTSPTEELGKWTRFLVFQVRIWRHCIKLLRINRCGTQAAALSYYTVFGIVPMTIVMLMIFQMIPAYRDMGQKVRNFAYDQMNLDEIVYPSESPSSDTEIPRQANDQSPGGSAEIMSPGAEEQEVDPNEISIAVKIDEITNQYMNKLNAGAIGFVGALLTMYAAIKLLTTIENSFNVICRISAGRTFLQLMINYWSLLTLGPLLLVLGIHMTTRFLMMKGLHQGMLPYIQPLFPFMISVLMFFFLFYVLPNTRISPGAALWGAVVAALLWSAAKWGFGLYVTKFVPFNAVWGILGIIPLTVVWIYWTWIFILFGLQLTYATQNLQTLDAAELARARRKTDACFLANDQTVTRIMEFVLRVFEQKEEQPVTPEQVASNLRMPVEFTQKVLDQLVKGGLMCRTTEPVSGYVPSTDGVHISLADVSRTVDELSYGQAKPVDNPKMVGVFHEIRQNLSNYTLKNVLEPFRREQLEQDLDVADTEE